MPHETGKKYSFENIVSMLKDYNNLKRKSLQLEFEISNYIPIATGDDIIDSMTFNKASDDGSSHPNGQTSDKTANIAISYAEKVDRLNIKYLQELKSDLRAINMEMLRLEFYINLLEKKYANILRMLYLEGLTLTKTAEKTKLSIDTVKNNRKAGINKLLDMYNSIVK